MSRILTSLLKSLPHFLWTFHVYFPAFQTPFYGFDERRKKTTQTSTKQRNISFINRTRSLIKNGITLKPGVIAHLLWRMRSVISAIASHPKARKILVHMVRWSYEKCWLSNMIGVIKIDCCGIHVHGNICCDWNMRLHAIWSLVTVTMTIITESEFSADEINSQLPQLHWRSGFVLNFIFVSFLCFFCRLLAISDHLFDYFVFGPSVVVRVHFKVHALLLADN